MFHNKKEMQKIYILENKIWKSEIIKYVETICNKKYYLDMIEKNKFIIRLYECSEFKREQFFLKFLLSSKPNIAIIIIMIKKRDLPLLNKNKKELIDIEIRYDNNINKFLTNEMLWDFLRQMIYCQMNLFIACGIVHNNIHEGNIFIEDNDKTLNYKHINKNIKSNKIYILSDFTKCRIYDPIYSSGINSEYDYNISLLKNLEDTFNLGKKLYEKICGIELSVSQKIKEQYEYIFRKNYDYNFINYNDDYKKFNEETIELCWKYVNEMLQKLSIFCHT